jgi:small subunit ribosomal protein S19e
MATVYEVPVDKLINETAEDLKENVKLKKPDWANYAKTGAHAERPPENPDWWWIRAASIMRKVYVNGPVGVRRLTTAYGGRKDRGVKPQEFRRAGGKNIRVILKELDALGYTEKVKDGRRITPKGQSYMDKIVNKIKV